jgi:hypothetical protein
MPLSQEQPAVILSLSFNHTKPMNSSGLNSTLVETIYVFNVHGDDESAPSSVIIIIDERITPIMTSVNERNTLLTLIEMKRSVASMQWFGASRISLAKNRDDGRADEPELEDRKDERASRRRKKATISPGGDDDVCLTHNLQCV